MRDPSGAVAGRIFAFRDISAEHAVEQMKSDFVSTVSVELRTPLTSIYGFAQTLLREDVAFGEPERRTFLEFIARESERLTTIVDALLNVARLDTGDLDVSLEPTDVASRRRATSSTSAAGRRERRISFVADVEDGGARGAGRSRQAAPGARPARLERGQVLARRRHGHGVGAPASTTRSSSRSPTKASASRPSERERIFSKFYKAGGGPRHGPRALHRAGSRARDGRQDVGRFGGRTGIAIRVRAAACRGTV